MDFYPPLEFENCGRHREPKFYTGYPDNAVHKRCTAICYILRNLENMGLQGKRGDPGSKNKFGLYQTYFLTPWLQGRLVIFGNFSLGDGGWKIFGLQGGWPFRGGLQNLGGAEVFDEFCKNVIENFSNIQ